MVTIEDGRRQLSQPFRPEGKAMPPMNAICASTSLDSDVGAIIPAATHLWSLPPRLGQSGGLCAGVQKVDGLWLPLRDETQVDVKVYGKRVLTIDHGPYQITDKSELAEEQLN
jgi:hypothetical protein